MWILDISTLVDPCAGLLSFRAAVPRFADKAPRLELGLWLEKSPKEASLRPVWR